MGVRRSFKFLLRPTSKQAAALTQCLEDHRELYNAALEHRRTAYRQAGVTVRYGEQSAELKHIRADDPDGQGRWSFSSQQATLRRLDKAFRAFFDRVKAGRMPGFPRFKGARPAGAARRGSVAAAATTGVSTSATEQPLARNHGAGLPWGAC
ncbi:transposase [Nonomuraea helvata]|uniref:Helix-turn-helix domain-containing protein n=1 Tax=Nonomuraea helvata TaxID=37484 RepID=A0ABV5RQ89_9ACTN